MFAQNEQDTVWLNEIEVAAPKVVTRRLDNGSLRFDSRMLGIIPRTLGEADPMQYIKTLPGVSSISDLSSGVNIDGMETSHNIYRLNGMPVHFPYHFGGILSTFSTELFPTVTLSKTVRSSADPDYLGGRIDVASRRTAPEQLTGNINVGMLASTLSLQSPVIGRFSIAGSARLCYLNLLYGNLLDRDNTRIDYDFNDADLHARWQPSSQSNIEATFHHNRDNLSYNDLEFDMVTMLRWRNLLAGLTWNQAGDDWRMTNRGYYSKFRNRLGVTMPQLGMYAFSSFAQAGLEGEIIATPVDAVVLRGGYALHSYSYEPQWIDSHGIGTNTAPVKIERSAWDCELFAEASAGIKNVTLAAGLRGGYFRSHDGYHHFAADPQVSVKWSAGEWAATLQATSSTQYIHQVGLSEIGLSSNFKLAADSSVPAQRQLAFSLGANRRVGRTLDLSADIYYKLMRNQAEYTGTVLDLTLPSYNVDDYIWTCRGYGLGADVMASYTLPGPLSAVLSYAWCRSRRVNPTTGQHFNSAAGIDHSLNMNAAWRFNEHWEVNGVFTLTSGRPYTPITAVYLIGERVMLEYGLRNAARMPAYHRLDLGASYKFITGGKIRLNHRIDFGVLNALNHRNVEMYTYTIDMDRLIIRRREIASLFRMLPSLSYSVSF